MKHFKILILVILSGLIIAPSFAQEKSKDITIADQWRTWTFVANSVNGIRSMNDGLHYTTNTRNGSILKYSYETGKITCNSIIIGRSGGLCRHPDLP